MPELTLNIILLILIGLVVVLGVLAMFWGTISKFLPWVKGPTINSATISVVNAQCMMKCVQDKSGICATGDQAWTLDYDLNGDAIADHVACATGTLIWGDGTAADVRASMPDGSTVESTPWAFQCCA